MRNTSNFVTYFERKSYSNQRMNFDVSRDNLLYLGNDVRLLIYYCKDMLGWNCCSI